MIKDQCKMNDIIFRYLKRNYKFIVKGYVSIILYDKANNKEESVTSVFSELKTIFHISGENLREPFDLWVNEELSILEMDY